MKLRHSIKPVAIVVLLLALNISCGRVKSDAKKAAKYTNKSIERTNQLKLKDAEKYFLKSQEIVQKYESHRKSDKFYNLYQQYRDEGKYPVEVAEDE